MVVSEINVFESGLPPSGGVALPPNKLVMRRMNVDLPHPESAARPMTTGPSRAHVVLTFARTAVRVDALRAAMRWETTRRWLKCVDVADTADIVVVVVDASGLRCIKIRWTCGDRDRSSRCVARGVARGASLARDRGSRSRSTFCVIGCPNPRWGGGISPIVTGQRDLNRALGLGTFARVAGGVVRVRKQ